MANFTVSPGVSISEIDNTFLTGQPIQAGAAIIGPTVKGPVEKPTLVTSYSSFQSLFGDTFISGGNAYSYFTSIAAYNYFNYGGTSLLVARVASGSYTSATSSYMPTGSSGPTTGLSPFVLETLSEGIIMNNSGSIVSSSLVTGSKENVRWEVTQPNTGSGNFNVLIRRGDDIQNSKIVLESFNNVNLDPNSNRFISKVIGDQKLNYNPSTVQMELSGSYPNISRYVRVKEVNYTTPNYLDSTGNVTNPVYTGSLPAAGSGSLGGAFAGANGTVLQSAINFYEDINSSNTQGLIGSDYDHMIALLGNSEAYQFNLLFTPGLTNSDHPSQITNIILNTQERGDNMFVLDLVPYNSTVLSTITQAQTRDSSYAASYWPWVRIIDPATGKHIWVPASTVIPGVYAFNDKVSAPWFAPAGINRGGLSTVLQAELKLTQNNRDNLYANNINPIATLPKQGVVVFGQKTLQKADSALDRVNVRRLLIELKNYVRQIADTILFEQNTIVTRNSFIARVTPFLEGIQQKQGLYAFKVIMDDTNNGPAVIDQNQLVGQIYIQPTRTAEFISLDFILLPTGAEFP
jgi:phage tail sheath protein FI